MPLAKAKKKYMLIIMFLTLGGVALIFVIDDGGDVPGSCSLHLWFDSP